MERREVEREMSRRARLLWQKILPGAGDGRGWTVAEILAYIQGRAWDRASLAARLHESTNTTNERRLERIRAGVRAMLAELEECLGLLEDEP